MYQPVDELSVDDNPRPNTGANGEKDQQVTLAIFWHSEVFPEGGRVRV